MGAFWSDAQNIFETARQASSAGAADCDWAILIGPQGGMRMLDASGWALSALQYERGASAAYRITRAGGRIQVEGRCGSSSCLLAHESAAEITRNLLAGPLPPMYYESSAQALLEAPCRPRGRDE